MGLRKNNPLDNSPHKLQKKVSPIKSSSGLLVTPKKTVIKSTAAAKATIKKKESWYKNGRRQQRSSSSSSALHRSGQVIRSSRFQRQVILFLVVLFYHSENPDLSSLLSSSPFHVLLNNTTTATSQHHDGNGMTSRAVRTHSFYSWIPKGRQPTTLSAPLPPPTANHRSSPFWKETIQAAQDTSLAMVQQSQKVWAQFGSASMAVFSFRWALPKGWKPQPLHPMSNQQSERKLLWLSSSPPPPSTLSSWPSSESSSMEVSPSYPQHYLRAASPATGSSPASLSKSLTRSKAPSHNTDDDDDDDDDDDEEWATATTTTTTTTQNLHPSSPMVVTLARLWQQAHRSPAQSWLPSSPAAATLSSFPSVGNDPNKFRHWVEKIYGASITTQHYDSHYRHGK